MARSSTSGQGRPLGAKNKATADVRAAAQEYGPKAIKALAALAGLLEDGKAESEQARVAALKEILDRAYGKTTQAVEVTGADGTPLVPILNLTVAKS